MNDDRVKHAMGKLFGLSEQDARVLLYIGLDVEAAWTKDLVAAALEERIASNDSWHPPYLAAMQRLAASPPDNIAEIGYFLVGLRAANAGEILADAPDEVIINLLSAIDPAVLSWPTARGLKDDIVYGCKGSFVIPRRLLEVFDEIEAVDEAEAEAQEEARERAKKMKPYGKPH